MIVRLLMPVGALALVATAMAQQPDQASRSIALFREAGKVLQTRAASTAIRWASGPRKPIA